MIKMAGHQVNVQVLDGEENPRLTYQSVVTIL
jgi:hypothetical protein